MEVKILTKKSYFSDWSYDRTDEARSFVRRWSMMTFSWKCCMRMLKMLHSGCTLVRHFQPRVHHIWMLHSLPCIICILYPLQGLTNVVFVSICTDFYVEIYDCVKCFSHFSCLWCSAHRTFSTVVAKMVSCTRLICVKKSLISELTFGHIWLLECFYKTFTVSVTDSVIVEQLHRVPVLIDVAAFSL